MDESWRDSEPSTSGTGKKHSRRRSVPDDTFRDGDDASSDGSITDDDAVSVTSSTSTVSSNGENCPICLNRLKNQTLGNPECCDHTFCFDCIREWSRCTTTCPIDRRSFSSIIAKDISGQILRKEPVELRLEHNNEEEDLTHCEVCRRSDREDRMLLCDRCDCGYHLECLTPPLNSVPLDAWFCPRCERQAIRAIPQRRRRAIPRTRANERVRARISIFLQQTEESSESSDEEIQDSNYESDDGVLYSLGDETQAQPTTKRVVRRKCTKRRKKRRSAKKSAFSTSTKRRRRRRKKRRTRRKGAFRKRSNSDPNLLDMKDPISKIKKRLADRLGIVKPPKKGQHLPQLKNTAAAFEAPAASGQFSLFGDKNELISFSDENDADVGQGTGYDGGAVLSDKAKRFRAPLRHPKQHTTHPADAAKEPKQNDGNDLLGGILESQALLLAKSSNTKINRDGSLEGKVDCAVGAKSDIARQNSNKTIGGTIDENGMDRDKSSFQGGKRLSDEFTKLDGDKKRPKMDEISIQNQRQIDEKKHGEIGHIHTPPASNSSALISAPGTRKRAPLLPSPTLVLSKMGGDQTSVGRRQTGRISESDNAQMQQHAELNVSGAPLRYAGHVPSSSPPLNNLMGENMSIHSNAAALIAAQIHQQNVILHQQQLHQQQLQQHQQLANMQSDQDPSPLTGNDVRDIGQPSGYSMLELIQQQQLLSTQQRLSSESASLEAIISANQMSALLAPSNLAAAACMQNALAAAAARQHQANFISTLRAASAQQQQLQHGLLPAAALVGTSGLNPMVLVGGSGLQHIWRQQLLSGQAPPPPPPPPPLPSSDMQLIPLPSQPYGIHSMIAPPPPPPPPPVPPPMTNPNIGPCYEMDFSTPSRSSLDARLSEIDIDNTVPPELVSLLHQFAQMKKEQSDQQFSRIHQASEMNLQAMQHIPGSSTAPKRDQSFVAVPVSPASSDNSLMVLDMATTTPSPEPAEPTPAHREGSRMKKAKNSVKFGADVVEADEKKVKLSKTEVKHIKREEKLKKLLNDASKDGSNGAGGMVEDGMPSSAVDLKRREKVVAKFNYQMAVEEAVKTALRPYYSKRKITKDEYKEIMRKCVPKVCKKKAEIKPDKIKAFVDTCVSKVLASRSKNVN